MSERLDPKLLHEGKRAKGALRASIALGLCAGWAVIAQAVLLAHLINAVSFQQARLPALEPWLAGLLGLFLLRALLSYAAERTASRAALAIKTSLRASILEKILARGPAAQPDSAETAAVLLDGVEALEPYFSRYLPQMYLCVAVPLAILALVLRLDWISFLVLLAAGPLIPLFMVFVGYRAEAINQQQWEKLLRLGTLFLDALQGLTTLKLFGRAQDEIALIARMSDDYRVATMEGLRIAFLTSAVLEFFASLGIALVAVLFGARLLHGHFNFYPAFLVLLLAPEFFVPLRGLAVHYHARMSAIAAAKQIFALLEAPVPGRGTASLAASETIEITCENVGFSYQDQAVLADINATFPAGKLTVIVGESGAGKTTLARLLLGFLAPETGNILINGQNLAMLTPESWWAQLAWVPQNPKLLAGSLAENIGLGRPEASYSDLRGAAARAHAYNFIQALPGDFETEIGEGGAKLSGGEIQRIALARAYLKDAKVLILDEATANLDAATEAEILDTMQTLARGRTSIVIAHRLAVAERADQILVLKDGKLAQTGTHAGLAAAPGPYRDLVQAREAGHA